MSMLGLSVGTTSRASMRPSGEQARQDVVGVGADHEPLQRQAAGVRDPAGEHVAEVARGHGEGEPAPAERARRPGVVRHLRGDARPVDGVRRGQADALAELGLAEELLDDALAVVERPVDRDGVHVRRLDGRHLAALDVTHAPFRVEHDDLGASACGQPRDRGRARVAGGRHEHRDALVALAQHVLEEPAHELEREILERERRAVEELQQPLAGVELDERADRGMAELRVGLVAQALEQGGLQLIAGERADDARGELRVGRSRPDGRKLGPALRHVQAAIAREAREQGVGEAERCRAAAGGDVAHASDRRGWP